MGQKYGAVISECLSNVKYGKELEAENLFELQDYAMEKLHSPLQSMLKSGFCASRSQWPSWPDYDDQDRTVSRDTHS